MATNQIVPDNRNTTSHIENCPECTEGIISGSDGLCEECRAAHEPPDS